MFTYVKYKIFFICQERKVQNCVFLTLQRYSVLKEHRDRHKLKKKTLRCFKGGERREERGERLCANEVNIVFGFGQIRLCWVGLGRVRIDCLHNLSFLSMINNFCFSVSLDICLSVSIYLCFSVPLFLCIFVSYFLFFQLTLS